MTFQTVKLKMGRAGAGLARGKGEKNSEESPRCRETSMSGGRATVGLGGKGEKNSEESQRCHETCIFLLNNIDLKFIHRFKVCLFERKYLFSRFEIRLNIDLSFVFSQRSRPADLR